MKIYDATNDNLGPQKVRDISNKTLFEGVAWDGTPRNRTQLPSDERIKAACDEAMSHDPAWVYIDDSQALSPLDVLELAERCAAYTECSVGYYAKPSGSDPYARNSLLETKSAIDQAWKNANAQWRSGFEHYTVLDAPEFDEVFSFACPSIYLVPNNNLHTTLTPRQAWRVASCETLLRAELDGLPIAAFVSNDDPKLREDEATSAYMARALCQWGRDIVIWGPGQKPLYEAIEKELAFRGM